MPHAAGLYYETHGRDDAPPLILSSGLGGSANYWKPNIPALAEHHRVIAYDHRGTGRSDRALPETHVRDEGMTYDLKCLMDNIGVVSAHMIGHAAGAMIGMSLAVEWPERVRSLVVVNGWGAPDPHFIHCFDTRLTLLRDSGVRAYIRAQPLFLYPANWLSEHWKQLDLEEDDQVAHFPTIDVMERRIAALQSFDAVSYLHNIDVPTQIIAAGDDTLVPSRCADRLVAAIPHAELALMPWGGHACNVTDPDTFNRIVLDFLRS